MRSKVPKNEPKATRTTDRYLVPIIAKTIDLLDCFGTDGQALNLKEIIQRTDLPHTTVFRILHTLVRRDYLTRTGHLYRINKSRRRLKFGFANLSTKIALAAEIQRSLEKATAQAGIDLLVWDNDRDADKAIKNAEDMAGKNLDIAIEFQLFEQVAPVIADIFARASVPVISVVNPHHGSLYVGVDNYRAGLSAGIALGDYALKHWRGRVDTLLLLESPPAGLTVQSRLVGAWRGVESRCGSINETSVRHIDSGGNRETAKTAALRYFKRGASKRLLIAGINDETAIGASEAAVECGLSKGIAIGGHGGSPEMCELIADPSSPCIGTVTFHPELYGPELVGFAQRVLGGRSSSPNHYIKHAFLGKDWLISHAKAG
jgi:ribose transport system substrate-binding protein